MGAYDKDFHAWAIEQATLLRAGKVGEADLENLAEEIESLGRSERRELVNRFAVLLAHLLKWQAQPDFRGTSWQLTIEEQRRRIQRHLDDNPSLKAGLSDWLAQGYELGVLAARRETGFGRQAFPPALPWTHDQVLDDEFFPV